MKITLVEYPGTFCFEMTAETIKDAAILTRMGLNATKKVNALYAHAHSMDSGSFTGAVSITKSKRGNSSIERKKQ